MNQNVMNEQETCNSGIDTRRGRLPDSYNIHWSDSRKAEVVRAVRDKLISFDEARWKYLLSKQEFEGWQEELSRKGQRDLAFDLAEVE